MQNLKIKSQNSGQSMFEVVIALFVITTILVGVVTMSTSSISNSLYSRSKNESSKYTQQAIEWLRSERQSNVSGFITYAQTPTYCLDTLAWTNIGSCLSTEVIPGTVYKRELKFTTTTISAKTIIEATVNTYWTDTKGYHEAKSVANFNDTRQIISVTSAPTASPTPTPTPVPTVTPTPTPTATSCIIIIGGRCF